ncbi:hypothetical protein RMCBS344292_06775 [Rhizopus microsporus]|nr:hypothetical protein RMCBS344292_06775 [Rhizopus microsporus]
MSRLSSVMRDVNTFISELDQPSTSPPRSQSFQQFSNAEYQKIERSNTTKTLVNHKFTEEEACLSFAEPSQKRVQQPCMSPENDYVNRYLKYKNEKTMVETRPLMLSTLSTGTSVSTVVPSNYAYLSALSEAFVKKIRALESIRELFCANVYPESFTGQEAINTLSNLLDGLPEPYCICIANTLMKTTPPLFEPIHYSQKSIIQGSLYPDEYYTLNEDMTDEMPQGILTGLLGCYTPNCHPNEGCYAPRCPNRYPLAFLEPFGNQELKAPKGTIGRTPSSSSHMEQKALSEAWAQNVPKELLETLSKREIARQEAINEMIYSERAYKNDLDTLNDVIVRPLLKDSNIIPSKQRREEFVSEVFGNYRELRELSLGLSDDLISLQQEQAYVPMIGDTLIQHMAYFEGPYTRYCSRMSLAEYLIKQESKVNPRLAMFFIQVEQDKRMRRLALRHFLLSPVTRMQRYPLLISAILKKTDTDHPDYTFLTKCLDMIKSVASRSDQMAEYYKRRVEILETNDALVFKPGNPHVDLELTDPRRRLFYQGIMKRRSYEKSDIFLFIFDHMVLMTKYKYRVWKKPIPIQMLYLNQRSSQTPPVSTATSRSLMPAASSNNNVASSNYALLYPLTICHLGRHGGAYNFLCSLEEKQKCIQAIEEAKSCLRKRMGEEVCELISLDDSSFRYSATTTLQGKVYCTFPFVTIHMEKILLVGTDNGVYIKNYDGTVRRIITCEEVTQLAILERYHILLILAAKTLKAYPIDLLMSNGKSPDKLGQTLGQHIHFFQIGMCNNRHLVVYKKKKNTSSIFTCLEPLYDLRDSKNQKYITPKTGFKLGGRSHHAWFKKYKEFYVGAEASRIQFLKSKFLIVCDRGFEVIDPENLAVGGREIPDRMDPQFNFVSREMIKPIAMYRVHDKFLLCYDKFAFFVNNRNGSLVYRGPQKLPLLCEWEGQPMDIVFQYPYVILFDAQFIEIRHVDTGELVQIIPGDQIRLTYFQTGDTAEIHGCMTHMIRSDIQQLFYLKLKAYHPRKML